MFHPYLSFQIPMIRTHGDAVIIFGTCGKPPEFFPGAPPAETAVGGGHFPVRDCLFLGIKFPGDEFGVTVVDGVDLFGFVFGFW